MRERTSLSSSLEAGRVKEWGGARAGALATRFPPVGKALPGSGHCCLLPGWGGSNENKGKGREVSLHLGLIRLPFLRLSGLNTFSAGSQLEKICKPVLRPGSGRQPWVKWGGCGYLIFISALLPPGFLPAPGSPQPGSSRNSEPGDCVTV